mgnify:CR=1 FL=1
MISGKHYIMLAEDEENIASTLKLNLTMSGYAVVHAATGTDAYKVFITENSKLDLALLDIMLPGINGFELCSEFRKTNPGVPVIFLTAKGEAADKISGLKIGADDYIVKPFELEEVLLRIQNVLKRNAPKTAAGFSFAGGTINFETFDVVASDGVTHTLSRREIGLLKLLTENENKVVSRDEIIEKLWGVDENASSRTIDNYILGFRKLFEKNPKEPLHFHSVRGVGYKFTAS